MKTHRSLHFRRMANGLVIGLAVAVPAYVQAAGTLLDAGSVAAEVDQRRDRLPSEETPDVQKDFPVPKGLSDAKQIRVDDAAFVGLEGRIPEEALRTVVLPYLHREQTIGGIWEMAARVTEELHRRGYPAAIALVPAQEIANGRVTLRVMLGHYGKIAIENHSELTSERAAGFSHRLRPQAFIEERPLDDVLRTMNNIAGVRAHAVLSPGATEGTADLRILLDCTERQGGAVFTDDYGSRYTGRWRTGFSYHRDNLAHAGDSFLHGAGDGLDSYDVRYEAPAGPYGVTMGAEAYRTEYDLMRQYARYDAYGTSTGWRVYGRVPLARRPESDVSFLCELGTQKTADRMDAIGPAADRQKHDETLRIGWDGAWRGARSAGTWKLLHTFGHMRFDNAPARQSAEAGKTAAYFQKTVLDAQDIVRLSPALTLHASLSAQAAWDNLDSSEKFYIGGYRGVRAFPQGETGGDLGVLGSVELRTPLGGAWSAAAFYDAGWVHDAKDPVTAGSNARTLAGAGLGLLYQGKSHLCARLDYAGPLSDRWSESLGKKTQGMWWFQLVDRF